MAQDQESIRLLKDIKYLTRNTQYAIGYQALTVDNTSGGVSLTIPAGTTYAEFVMESSVTSGIVARYLNCGGATGVPSSSAGLALSHLDRFDMAELENLRLLRIIQTQGGTHTLHIQYYKLP